MELIAAHGYWLSFSKENLLGELSDGQVKATSNILSENQSAHAFYPLGRVHAAFPYRVGQIMRERTINPSRKILPSRVAAGDDDSVNKTLLELMEVGKYLAAHKEFTQVIHLVNPTHLERVKLLFEELSGYRANLGLSTVSFDFGVTTEYLSKEQSAVLLGSPEQAAYDARERSIKNLKGKPLLEGVIDRIPQAVKRRLEDRLVRKFSKP